MVDFGKLLGQKQLKKPTDPLIIFDNLDKVSGKEHLRPSQKAVLEEWHNNRRDERDIIVKIHTGQGKTLVGLLMLQSLLNEKEEPVIYICPNNYLVSKTITEAQQFGFETVQFEIGERFPKDFLNSKRILITNCSKLFNGKSIFGVRGTRGSVIPLGGIVMDDAHTCLDIIRDSFSIKVKRLTPNGNLDPLFKELISLFEEPLMRQALGTFTDIQNGRQDCLMAVPFWSWYERRNEVLKILQKHQNRNELLFVWNFIKDQLDYSMCFFSGETLEITPMVIPIELIPSFTGAGKRIFLSATLTEDAFLVRDLGLDPESVSNPLSKGDVNYSGERLIIIPALVDPNLNRELIIKWISKVAQKYGNFGVVSLVPSDYIADQWAKWGGIKAHVENLERNLIDLELNIRQNIAKQVLILVNKYDGVDLRDHLCRILCLDSLPSYNSLINRHFQDVRPNSNIIVRQLAQRIEQGMGRGIRGSNDYCIVIVIGNYITEFLSMDRKRKFLSSETQRQIEIGEELANEMRAEENPLIALRKLIEQCLKRNSQWKEYYRSRMSNVEPRPPFKEYLKISTFEREASNLLRKGQYREATERLQELVGMVEGMDKGWFLQLMAMYQYPYDASRAMDSQLKAFSLNDRLFRPERGLYYTKLVTSGIQRVNILLDKIKSFEKFNNLFIHITNILDQLSFNVDSAMFERGIDELGKVLGFSTQRPDKSMRCGPDNLWQIVSHNYFVIECKNNVLSQNKYISKDEINQLASSIAWFHSEYPKANGKPVLIHPSTVLDKNAFIDEPFWVIDQKTLVDFKNSVNNFFLSFKDVPFDNLTAQTIEKKIKEYNLDLNGLEKKFLIRGSNYT
ncbi:MAG TPA: DEAD/DEAH box helicase family protein [Candidatus Deferrimicrobium sp.]|nr:DEAD/DEAH box helicase family protein [Candidatus Deferrimicrobium sp.]